MLGLYRNEIVFGVIAHNVVYLKVDDSNKTKFLDAGLETLKVFKNNTEIPSYYELPVDILENAEEFIEWAKESYEVQIKK